MSAEQAARDIVARSGWGSSMMAAPSWVRITARWGRLVAVQSFRFRLSEQEANEATLRLLVRARHDASFAAQLQTVVVLGKGEGIAPYIVREAGATP